MKDSNDFERLLRLKCLKEKINDYLRQLGLHFQ